MLKIGISGQPGFMGTHLYNFLGLEDDIERIPFEDTFFDDETSLRNFVKDCDVIFHFGGNEPAS